MRKRVLKVFSLFIVLSIFISQFNFLSEVEAVYPTLILKYQSEEEVPFTTPQGGRTKYRRTTLSDAPAYCVDYARALPQGATRKWSNFRLPRRNVS